MKRAGLKLPYRGVVDEIYFSDAPAYDIIIRQHPKWELTESIIYNIKMKRSHKEFTDYLDYIGGRPDDPVKVKSKPLDESKTKTTKSLDEPKKITKKISDEPDEEDWMRRVVSEDLDGGCYDEFGEFLGTKKAGRRR